MTRLADIYNDCLETLDYSALPDTARHAMRSYVERGVSPGTGIRLILENDLAAVLHFEDMETLRATVRWVHSNLHGSLWGSASHMRNWQSFARQRASESRKAC